MTMSGYPPGPRSQQVRDTIRRTAARLFATKGFEATGLRDVAQAAGVNHAIIIRHFGSKENLFLESFNASPIFQDILNAPLDELAERTVWAATSSSGRTLSSFGTLIRAAGREGVRIYLRRLIIDSFAAPLALRLSGPDAELRAHLFAAELVGLLVARSAYEDPVLRDVSQERLNRWTLQSLQALLDGS